MDVSPSGCVVVRGRAAPEAGKSWVIQILGSGEERDRYMDLRERPRDLLWR